MNRSESTKRTYVLATRMSPDYTARSWRTERRLLMCRTDNGTTRNNSED